MSKLNKHLTLSDRKDIEKGLNEDLKLVRIADLIGKDERTISKEIYKHRYLKANQSKRYPNNCGRQKVCDKSHLCDSDKCLNGKCKFCGHNNCNDLCEDYIDTPICKRVLKYPFVCNGCQFYKGCYSPKYIYDCQIANQEYKDNIAKDKGPNKYDIETFKDIDYKILQGVRNGLSIGVICKTMLTGYSESHIYKLIADNQLSTKRIDLKRAVRYKQCKKNNDDKPKRTYDYLKGRTMSDYGDFIINNPKGLIWQMDSVIGKVDESACVLTLLLINTNLQLYFKLESKTTREVTRIFDCIKDFLGTDLFKETFSCILTDNGAEFKDPLSIEIDDNTNELLTKVFFCKPNRSDEKGKCEKNHEHFREFIPKGKSLVAYDQITMNQISNQVNNYPRRMFNYKSPYEISIPLINKKVFELNKLSYLSIDKLKLKHIK